MKNSAKRPDLGLETAASARGEKLERHGGWIISMAFHIALFLLMINAQFRQASSAPPPEPITVTLNPESPPPPEEAQPEVQQVASDALPPQAAATSAEEPKQESEDSLSAEVEALAREQLAEQIDSAGLTDEGAEDRLKSPEIEVAEAEPMESAAEAETQELAAQAPIEEQPESPDADQLLAERRAREQEEREFLEQIQARKRSPMAEQSEELSRRGSGKVADRLQKLSVGRQAKKWLTDTEGVKEGVIRALDVSDVPANVAERVLERYGIKILIKELDGAPDSYNFLNQAKTDGGTYTSRAGRGVYQVFSYSRQAISRMMQLEVEALQARGMDPATARVVEVEFGVINTTRGYDLGVKDMKAVPLTEAEQ